MLFQSCELQNENGFLSNFSNKSLQKTNSFKKPFSCYSSQKGLKTQFFWAKYIFFCKNEFSKHSSLCSPTTFLSLLQTCWDTLYWVLTFVKRLTQDFQRLHFSCRGKRRTREAASTDALGSSGALLLLHQCSFKACLPTSMSKEFSCCWRERQHLQG